MGSRALVLLILAAGCAPSALRVPPPDGEGVAGGPGPGGNDAAADGGTSDGAADGAVLRCFPKPKPSGPDQPGDFCVSPDQCQHAPDEIARCDSRNAMEYQQKILRCQRYSRAKLGEPCFGTLTETGGLEGPSPLGGPNVPDTGGYCDVYDGLVCDQLTRVCRPLPVRGEDCTTHPHCPRGSRCDGVCVAGKALGEPCQAVNDFTGQPECATGTRCDLVMNTCVPATADGDACEFPQQCASGACVAGACAPAGTTCPS